MAIITDLVVSYQDTLDLRLYDPNTDTSEDVHAVDVQPVHLLAIDAAYERRCSVEVPVDEYRHIVRVFCTAPAPTDSEPDIAIPEHVISRISTQEATNIPEVFVYIDPSDPSRGEEVYATKTALLHIACHGAYLSRRPLTLKIDDSHCITQVEKHRFPPPPP
jgi:hypothetical protein